MAARDAVCVSNWFSSFAARKFYNNLAEAVGCCTCFPLSTVCSGGKVSFVSQVHCRYPWVNHSLLSIWCGFSKGGNFVHCSFVPSSVIRRNRHINHPEDRSKRRKPHSFPSLPYLPAHTTVFLGGSGIALPSLLSVFATVLRSVYVRGRLTNQSHTSRIRNYQ